VRAAGLAAMGMIDLGAVARRAGGDPISHRTDRCAWSLFQLGLQLRDHWLTESLRIEVAVCPPPPLSAVT